MYEAAGFKVRVSKNKRYRNRKKRSDKQKHEFEDAELQENLREKKPPICKESKSPSQDYDKMNKEVTLINTQGPSNVKKYDTKDDRKNKEGPINESEPQSSSFIGHSNAEKDNKLWRDLANLVDMLEEGCPVVKNVSVPTKKFRQIASNGDQEEPTSSQRLHMVSDTDQKYPGSSQQLRKHSESEQKEPEISQQLCKLSNTKQKEPVSSQRVHKLPDTEEEEFMSPDNKESEDEEPTFSTETESNVWMELKLNNNEGYSDLLNTIPDELREEYEVFYVSQIAAFTETIEKQNETKELQDSCTVENLELEVESTDHGKEKEENIIKEKEEANDRDRERSPQRRAQKVCDYRNTLKNDLVSEIIKELIQHQTSYLDSVVKALQVSEKENVQPIRSIRSLNFKEKYNQQKDDVTKVLDIEEVIRPGHCGTEKVKDDKPILAETDYVQLLQDDEPSVSVKINYVQLGKDVGPYVSTEKDFDDEPSTSSEIEHVQNVEADDSSVSSEALPSSAVYNATRLKFYNSENEESTSTGAIRPGAEKCFYEDISEGKSIPQKINKNRTRQATGVRNQANETSNDEESVIDGTTRYEPLQFHSVHGANVRLCEDGFVAQRKNVSHFFDHGIAFSSRHIEIQEKIFIQLEEISNHWAGYLTFGFTNHDPQTLASDLPATVIRGLDNKPGYWTGLQAQASINRGDVFHFYANSSGTVGFGINGVDKGKLFWNVDTTKPIWALVDVSGSFTSIKLVASRISTEAHITSSISVPLLPRLKYQNGIQLMPLKLHANSGKSVRIMEYKGLAARSDSTVKHGYVFTHSPMRPGQTIVIQILSTGPGYEFLPVGLTCSDPGKLHICELPDNAEGLSEWKQNWVVFKNVVNFIRGGDELAITRTLEGDIILKRNNGEPITVIRVRRTLKFWAFVEMFGSIEMLRMWSTINKHEYAQILGKLNDLNF